MSRLAYLLHRTTWLAWLLLAGSALGLWWMINDNEPPLVLHSYVATSPRAGEVLYVVGQVTRDVSRNCKVVGSRHIFDGAGVKWEVMPATKLPANVIRQIEYETPNRWPVALTIPLGATPGRAKFVTSLLYQCNPLQAIWPIEVVLVVEFIIAP